MSTQTSQQPSPGVVNYDPKLEGVQKGIEVFGDMTLKQLNFIAKKLRDIPVVRGCYNVCSHCIVEAKPPIREDETHINKMAYEDFKALCDGFKELNSRLGYNIFSNGNTKYMSGKLKTLFYDSDGAYVQLKDENGGDHYFMELASMVMETTGMPSVFDTTGWNPKDKVAQERMEKYAGHYGDSSNLKNILYFNFSVNPFQSIYTSSVKLRKEGNLEKAEEHRNAFIERTVNALFTITPVIKMPFFNFIARALPNNTKGAEGFTTNDCFLLFVDVFKRLEEKYYEDLNSPEPKMITSKAQIKEALDKLYIKLRSIEAIRFPVGRIVNLYQENDPAFEAVKKYRKKSLDNFKNVFSPESGIFGIIDLNGRVYIGDYYTRTMATELAFNFKNKDKKTAPISPNLVDFTITNDFLEMIL